MATKNAVLGARRLSSRMTLTMIKTVSKKVNVLTGQIDSNQFWLDVAYHLTITVIYYEVYYSSSRFEDQMKVLCK